jgi:hypothetical protein
MDKICIVLGVRTCCTGPSFAGGVILVRPITGQRHTVQAVIVVAIKIGGMVNAGFLAVLRLMNGWYLGVCSTGSDQKP